MIQLLLAYAVKAALILAAAAFIVRAIRAAALRQIVWLAAIAATLLLLPLAFLVPQLHLGMVAAGRAGPGLNLLLALWLVPAVLLLASVLAGQWRLARMARAAAAASPRVIAAAAEAASAMGVRRRVRIGQAPGPMPLAFGMLRPVILIPAGADHWPEARLRMTLLHEMAHIARADPAARALASVVQAIHWFNPLARIGARAILAESERACDALVLKAGVEPGDYAHLLLETAREAAAGGRAAPAGASAMISFEDLEARLKAILSPAADADRLRPGGAAGLLLAVAGAVTLSLAPMRAESDPHAGRRALPAPVDLDARFQYR